MSQFFASDGQSIRVSASVLLMNIQDWFPLGWTRLISLMSKGLEESSSAPQFESINTLAFSLLCGPNLTSIHDYQKNPIFDYTDIFGKTMSLLFNMLSKFVTAFLPKSKPLLISGLLSPSAVILEPKKVKSVTVSIVSPSIYHEVLGQYAMILVF